MNRSRGFTLIELMITVAIVGILASIALPSYREYVRRGRIAEATELLSEAKIALEQAYANSRTYAGAKFRGVSICTAAIKTDSQLFSIQADSAGCDTAGFKLEATGSGDMTGFKYSIDQANTKTSTFTSISGWSDGTTCWVNKKGMTC